MDRPIVSVIIPTYNRAKFITGAVESVLEQSLRSIEIIVVDDGSTDDTRKVIDRFLIDDRIKYVHTENGGAAHARNTGMKAASGKYIAFLDSDDAYLPYKLELQTSFLESNPDIGMVYTEASAFDDAAFIEENHLRSYHQLYNRKGWAYKDIFPASGELAFAPLGKPVSWYSGNLFRYVLMGPLVMSPTVMFPAAVLKAVGYQNENYRLAEEYEHIVRVCKHYKVGFLDVPTYLIHYHGDQISMAKEPWSMEKALNEIETEKVLLQAVLDWGYKDAEYYAGNSWWLNPRLAELYHCLGEKWLEYGNDQAARDCFSKGLSFDPSWKKNRLCWYQSFLPAIARRVLRGVSVRMESRFSHL